MKVCPECAGIYADFVDFCFADGAVLVAAAKTTADAPDWLDAPPAPPRRAFQAEDLDAPLPPRRPSNRPSPPPAADIEGVEELDGIPFEDDFTDAVDAPPAPRRGPFSPSVPTGAGPLDAPTVATGGEQPSGLVSMQDPTSEESDEFVEDATTEMDVPPPAEGVEPSPADDGTSPVAFTSSDSSNADSGAGLAVPNRAESEPKRGLAVGGGLVVLALLTGTGFLLMDEKGTSSSQDSPRTTEAMTLEEPRPAAGGHTREAERPPEAVPRAPGTSTPGETGPARAGRTETESPATLPSPSPDATTADVDEAVTATESVSTVSPQTTPSPELRA